MQKQRGKNMEHENPCRRLDQCFSTESIDPLGSLKLFQALKNIYSGMPKSECLDFGTRRKLNFFMFCYQIEISVRNHNCFIRISDVVLLGELPIIYQCQKVLRAEKL